MAIAECVRASARTRDLLGCIKWWLMNEGRRMWRGRRWNRNGIEKNEEAHTFAFISLCLVAMNGFLSSFHSFFFSLAAVFVFSFSLERREHIAKVSPKVQISWCYTVARPALLGASVHNRFTDIQQGFPFTFSGLVLLLWWLQPSSQGDQFSCTESSVSISYWLIHCILQFCARFPSLFIVSGESSLHSSFRKSPIHFRREAKVKEANEKRNKRIKLENKGICVVTICDLVNLKTEREQKAKYTNSSNRSNWFEWEELRAMYRRHNNLSSYCGTVNNISQWPSFDFVRCDPAIIFDFVY